MSDTIREDPAERAAIEEALQLAALPPPGDEELRVVAAGAPGVLRSWRRDATRRRALRVGLAAFAAAAAVALFAASPWLLHGARRGTTATSPVAAEWVPPDLEANWQLAGVLEGDAATADEAAPAADATAEPLFAELSDLDLDEN